MAPAPAGHNSGSLEIEVAQLRSSKGMIRLCLTADPADFPDCKNAANAIQRSYPAGTTHIRFDGLPPGTYAFAVIHDENGNAKLDTFAGIPREGFGFSRNPAIRFGPPRFASASFEVGAEPVWQQVRMRYML